MDLSFIVLLVMGLLILMIAIEVPVAYALGISGALGLVLLSGSGVAGASLARLPFSTVAKFGLVIIPMFIAMGVFAKQDGMAEQVFALAARGLRRVPGGLALAALFACAAFAAVSGSSVATVVSVGQLSVAEMRKYGYSKTFAAGVIGAAGTLGVLIPPSVILVLYGILTGESIGQMLVAGIIPGIISAILYAVTIVVRVMRNPELVGRSRDEAAPATVGGSAIGGGGAPHQRSASGAVGDTAETDQGPVGLGGLLRIGILFAIVVGGIYSGLFTAIESSAIGASAALLILFYDKARLGGVAVLLRSAKEALIEAVSINSMVFMLLIGAGLFSAFTITARIPQIFSRWILSFELSPTLLVVVLLLAFIPLGMFLDPISILLIGVPITYPVVTALGFDGIWFGILVVKTVEIGFITPPLGINAYVIAGAIDDLTVDDAFKGVLGFLPTDVITIMVLFLFPSLTLWLPALLK
jgi:C4-dicarboxylate transporter, DctM subunit